MLKFYETDRLILRVLDESSAQLVLDYMKRNREFLNEWEPARGNDFYELPIHEKMLNSDLETIEKGVGLRLWIFKKEELENNRVIGCVSFNNIVRGVFLSCHLGYKLDKDEINKGYITEAIKKGIEVMFNEYKLHRIEANIMPKNKRSLRVVEKLGFYNEGLAKKYLRINGIWEDHIHMVFLNEAME